MLYKRQIALVGFMLLTVAVAIPVSQAQVRPVGLSDSQEPGSVLVFPFFETGNLSTEQGQLPQTLFEVSAVCPKGATCPVTGQDVYIHFDFVCGGDFFKQCADSNFTLHTTVHGTIRFDANGDACSPQPSFVDQKGCGFPAQPFCEEGYLIGWVVDTNDRPIKFDGLIGDAVLREQEERGSNPNTTGTATEYDAITIQAGASLANLALINTVAPDSPGDLEFDGTHYQKITGKIYGSVRYDNTTTAEAASQKTYLALLTLDVKSNRLNPKIDVDLNFYNETEAPVSTNTSFFCFEETDSLSTINASLTSAFCGPSGGGPADTYCKGEVESTKAVGDLRGNPVTLLGLVINREYDSGNTLIRTFSSALSNDSIAIDTDFVP
jgi:hypothetical protein